MRKLILTGAMALTVSAAQAQDYKPVLDRCCR